MVDVEETALQDPPETLGVDVGGARVSGFWRGRQARNSGLGFADEGARGAGYD
jgi:hypothetical protein